MPYPTKEVDISYKLVFVVGGLMSLIAGYINSIMLLSFQLPVSQMTGIASHLSEGLYDGKLLWESLAILCSFMAGAFISGWLIGHSQYRQSSSYGTALLINGSLLLLAIILYPLLPFLTLLLTAVACGLQNALVASYKGLQVRTTHVTGITTDIGVHLAQTIKHKQPFDWRAWLLICLLISFIIGGLFGVLVYPVWQVNSLWLASALSAILGAIYLQTLKIHSS